MVKSMKRKFIKCLCIALTFLALSTSFIPVYAVETMSIGSVPASNGIITPFYANCDSCSATFTVIDPGEAHFAVVYNAKPDVFTQAKVTVKIEKRFLGLFWTTVDIGEPNNEWIAYSNSTDGRFYNVEIDGSGTYRATYTVEFRGVGGTVDIIEDSIECKYS